MRSNAGILVAVGFVLTASLATAASGTVIHYGPNQPYQVVSSPDNLVFNGDFNVDPLVDPDNKFAANPHVTGWTISPQNEFPGTRNSNAGVGADGRGLRLGDLNLVDVSQALTTVANRAYRLSFFLAVEGDPGNLLRVSANDQLLANLDGTPYLIGYGFFSKYIYDFRADSPVTNLTFQYQSPIGDQYLSNVSVRALPEPATWAMMIGGMGLVGCAARRRRVVTTEGA